MPPIALQTKRRRGASAGLPAPPRRRGSPSYAIIEALSRPGAAPVFDRARMPEMGSVTELAEVDGEWRVVGNASAAGRVEAGAVRWEAAWREGAAVGADARKL
eukprot:gene630-1558_t